MKKLVDALMEPDAWPFPVEKVEHLETHISHLFLVGDLVYKLKKPLDLGFLDFSTLEKRRYYCGEEVRLNSRTAPRIYLARVPITRDGQGYHVEGEGEAVEYAVKMRRFDQGGLLDRHPMDEELIDALAEKVAAFHRSLVPAPPASHWGEPDKVWFPMGQNFEQIEQLGLFPEEAERLKGLAGRARDLHGKLVPLLRQRKRQGCIRECHGDLHLGNIALVEGEVILFDGIEFNEELRWIDMANDIAFLLMDLEQRGWHHFAWRFLNRYLETVGDYQGAPLLPLYKSYRAMVRAKVAAIRLAQGQLPVTQAQALREEFLRYLERAETAIRLSGKPTLYITHGLSGSGKSHLCFGLRERMGLIHLRSDVERKRLFGLEAEESSRSGLERGIYTAEATQRTYQRLAELAETLLQGGYSVLVDATFLGRSKRDSFCRLAEGNRARFRILEMQSPETLLRERIRSRSEAGGDASEADLAVLDRQLESREPLTSEEARFVIPIDTSQPPQWETLTERLLG